MPIPSLHHRESIWEYPRRPHVETISRHLQVFHRGVLLANTHRALRVCKNGHPPTYFIPPAEVRMELFEPSPRRTFCEWVGIASFFHVVVAGEAFLNVACSYREPRRGYESLAYHLAFFPALVDACLVDGEAARPEPRHTHGGWITSDLQGPFR